MYLRNTIFAAVFVTSAIAHADGVGGSCESAIAYNTTEIQSNVASRLAVWESVDRATFEARKSGGGLGIVVYGIPVNLSYEQFEERRTQLRQSLALQQDVNISTNARWQAVDPASTANYVACIDAQTGKKFSTSTVYATRDTVAIRVKKTENAAQINADKLVVQAVTGGQLQNKKPIVMKGNAATTLSFKRRRGTPFEVTIALVTKKGDQIDSASFAIPRFTNIRVESDISEKSSAKVRCENTYRGDAQGLMTVTADFGETLVVGTQSPKYEILDGRCGPGGVFTNFEDQPSSTRIVMSGACASSDNKCTMPVNIWFTVQAKRDRFIDVDAEERAARRARRTKVSS